MAGKGRVPQRMCAGCGRRLPKSSLIRFVAGAAAAAPGEAAVEKTCVVLDLQGKSSGRGAYVCRNIKCFDTAQKRKSLHRKLGGAGSDQSLRDEFIRLIGN